jgi:3',5'-cyclic AMP phosphodiesterase CpdA
MKIILLTDPHLVAGNGILFGHDLDAQLGRAVKSIAKFHADADMCILTGDITHWGQPEAYDKMNRALVGLTMPCHLLVGNHDLRSAFCTAFPNTPTADGFVQYSLDFPVGRMIILDTLTEGSPAGELCAIRLAWFKNQLREARDNAQDVYVFMHHAPLSIGVHGVDRIALNDQEAFWYAVSDAGNVRHVFFGHTHRNCHGVWHDTPFTCIGTSSYQVALILDDHTPLHLGKEEPVYQVLTITEAGVVIHRQNFLQDDSFVKYSRGHPDTGGGAPEHQKEWDAKDPDRS